jgi:hypothetical protein
MRFRLLFDGVLLVVGLLGASLGVAQSGGTQSDGLTPDDARKIIVDLNAKWGKARVDLDKATMEKMLAPDFYVRIGEQKISRKDFIDQISTPNPSGKLLRFDVQVLTVMRKGDHWDAVIAEKLEGEGKGPDGKQHHSYSLWITRDGWKKVGDEWVALYSEAVGNQFWRDQKPPVANWES